LDGTDRRGIAELCECPEDPRPDRRIFIDQSVDKWLERPRVSHKTKDAGRSSTSEEVATFELINRPGDGKEVAHQQVNEPDSVRIAWYQQLESFSERDEFERRWAECPSDGPNVDLDEIDCLTG
jgi:hypothetical protein